MIFNCQSGFFGKANRENMSEILDLSNVETVCIERPNLPFVIFLPNWSDWLAITYFITISHLVVSYLLHHSQLITYFSILVGEPRFKCKICNEAFFRHREFENHMKTQHPSTYLPSSMYIISPIFLKVYIVETVLNSIWSSY